MMKLAVSGLLQCCCFFAACGLTGLDAFDADVALIISNCRLYNQPDTPYCRVASLVETCWHKLRERVKVKFATAAAQDADDEAKAAAERSLSSSSLAGGGGSGAYGGAVSGGLSSASSGQSSFLRKAAERGGQAGACGGLGGGGGGLVAVVRPMLLPGCLALWRVVYIQQEEVAE